MTPMRRFVCSPLGGASGLADSLALLRYVIYTPGRPLTTYTCRYTEHGSEFVLRAWGETTINIPPSGPLASRPQWLVDIVNLGKLGAHGSEVPNPPPDYILWFDIDGNFNFIRFVAFNSME